MTILTQIAAVRVCCVLNCHILGYKLSPKLREGGYLLSVKHAGVAESWEKLFIDVIITNKIK